MNDRYGPPDRSDEVITVIDGDDSAMLQYSRRVGVRLRQIRRQKRWSLQDVETESDSEFKMSVVGAYERGERAISLHRLDRLATLYGVPIEQFLPIDERRDGLVRTHAGDADRVVIDLSRLEAQDGPPFEMLRRYIRMTQVLRQDFGGFAFSIRADDQPCVAAMLGVGPGEIFHSLTTLGLIFGFE